MKFSKYEGTGNDFIMIEDMKEKLSEHDMSSIAVRACNRHFGIGADGAIFIKNTSVADMQMIIVNSDGSFAKMCGNGIRCFVKYLFDKNIVRKENIKVLTGSGVREVFLEIEGDNLKSIKVNMGKVDFDTSKMSIFSEINNMKVSVLEQNFIISSMLLGVPHTVILNKDFSKGVAKELEKSSIFTQGSNINFCKIIDRNNIEVRTFERGAGFTLSCGSGSCASFAVCFRNLLVNSEINIKLLGGDIKASIKDDIIYMLGNANFICDGIFAFSEG